MDDNKEKINTDKLKEISQEELEDIDGTKSIPVIKNSVNYDIGKHSLGETLKDIFKYVTTRSSNELFQLVWRLVLIAVVVIVMFVPVQLVRDLGSDLLISFGVNFDGKSLDTYNLVWNLAYTIVGIVLFFKLVKTRFYRLVKDVEIKK